ncbi:FAD-dependent oxidoreductase, partial [Campylobacter jejuni]
MIRRAPARGACRHCDRHELVRTGCAAAAVTLRREDRSVALACRDGWIGGLSTNGLGYADAGAHAAVGGLTRRFYRDVRSYYRDRGIADIPVPQDHPGARNDDPDTQWVFEPH